MKISIFGNGDKIYSEENIVTIAKTINELILNSSKLEIYIGYQGNFDKLIYTLLSKHQDRKKYKLFLVIPYINTKITEEFRLTFDDVIYPPIELCPYRAKILQRNYWMVDHSDMCIFYVDYAWGGSGKTLRYAMKKNKKYTNLGSYKFD